MSGARVLAPDRVLPRTAGKLAARRARGGRLDAALAGACRARARGAAMLILLDLDGTLADFKVDPKKVSLYPGVRDALARLLETPRVRVKIVTGRRAPEAHAIVGLPLDVIGLHGREMFSAGRNRALRAPARARKALDALLVRGSEIAARHPGIRLEDKRPGGVALHTRGAPAVTARRAEAEFREEIARVHGEGLELVTGKKLSEARVAGATKGTAAAALAERVVEAARRAGRPRPVILFAGDDVTDEDAHRALRRFRAITILVARRPRPSAARYRVPSIAAMKRVLERLAER